MTTWTAITTLPDNPSAQALAEAVENVTPAPIGVACLEIEDGSGLYEVAAYFDEKPDEIGLTILTTIFAQKPFLISKLDDTDWVAQVKRELTPVRAGRFLVHGSHDRDQLAPSDIGLEIEAAMAFGTGHHGTTLGCLEITDELFHEGLRPQRIADIGTGTGILAMAAARRFPDARVIASDIETISVATSKANFAVNKTKRIRVVEAMGFNHPLHRQNAPYDLIYANILARPLRRLAPEMYANLQSGGRIVLSGILRRQGAGVVATYTANGFHLAGKREIGEWVSFVFAKG